MVRLEQRTVQHAVGAAVALLVLSVGGWMILVGSDPQVYWRLGDATVYRDAGAAVLRGRELYPGRFGVPQLPFTYPPFAGVLFAAASPLPFGGWKVVLVGLDLCCLVVSSLAAVRLTGRRTTECWAPALVIAAVGLWLEPVASTLLFGQLNLALMALVLADLAFARDTRLAGVGIGLAAGIKLTPLVFVGYLMFSGRRRAAATATLTAAGTVAVGLLAIPSDAVRYWSGRVLAPGDGPERLVNQSVRGVLLRLTHRATGGQPLWFLVALAVGVLGLASAVHAARAGRDLLGVCLCAATGLLVSPISWSHHWVWVVVLLPLAVPGSRPSPLRWGGAALVVALFAWWPLPVGTHGGWTARLAPHPSGLLRIQPHDDGRELHWSGWQLFAGSYYVLAGALFLLGAAISLPWLTYEARAANRRAEVSRR